MVTHIVLCVNFWLVQGSLPLVANPIIVGLPIGILVVNASQDVVQRGAPLHAQGLDHLLGFYWLR